MVARSIKKARRHVGAGSLKAEKAAAHRKARRAARVNVQVGAYDAAGRDNYCLTGRDVS